MWAVCPCKEDEGPECLSQLRLVLSGAGVHAKSWVSKPQTTAHGRVLEVPLHFVCPILYFSLGEEIGMFVQGKSSSV